MEFIKWSHTFEHTLFVKYSYQKSIKFSKISAPQSPLSDLDMTYGHVKPRGHLGPLDLMQPEAFLCRIYEQLRPSLNFKGELMK